MMPQFTVCRPVRTSSVFLSRKKSICHAVLGALAVCAFTPGAWAGLSVIQPPRKVDVEQPYTLTLLLSGDQNGQRFALPAELAVAASVDLVAPVKVPLQRVGGGSGVIVLQPGEYREVAYQGRLPPQLRGPVRIEPLGIDAAPVTVSVVKVVSDQNRKDSRQDAGHSLQADAITGSQSFGTPAVGVSHPEVASLPTLSELNAARRLSFSEPMYFEAGNNGGRNAKFQVSFKYRLYQSEDASSRGLLNNLYLGYTQFSLWDLHSASSPFRDTNYRPSLFYYIQDSGFSWGPLTRVGVTAGLEHESNGRDGPESRSLNSFIFKPSLAFGDLSGYHLTVEPKFIQFIGSLSDNPDLGQYRGHVDLRLSFGSPDGYRLSTLLRKGTASNKGSIDTTLSYPLSRILPGTAGYLTASYFYGYGESLLDYNVKSTPQFRIGYALWR